MNLPARPGATSASLISRKIREYTERVTLNDNGSLGEDGAGDNLSEMCWIVELEHLLINLDMLIPQIRSRIYFISETQIFPSDIQKS